MCLFIAAHVRLFSWRVANNMRTHWYALNLYVLREIDCLLFYKLTQQTITAVCEVKRKIVENMKLKLLGSLWWWMSAFIAAPPVCPSTVLRWGYIPLKMFYFSSNGIQKKCIFLPHCIHPTAVGTIQNLSNSCRDKLLLAHYFGSLAHKHTVGTSHYIPTNPWYKTVGSCFRQSCSDNLRCYLSTDSTHAANKRIDTVVASLMNPHPQSFHIATGHQKRELYPENEDIWL